MVCEGMFGVMAVHFGLAFWRDDAMTLRRDLRLTGCLYSVR